MLVPDDLAERWRLTDWSLANHAWSLHIALATYPIPKCFEIARQYEAFAVARKEFGQPAPARAKKKQQKKSKEQMELW